MKITRKTKWAKVAPFLNEERLAQLKKGIQDCAFFEFWKMDIGDFSLMLQYGVIEEWHKRITGTEKWYKKLFKSKVEVYEAMTYINACDAFMKEFKSVMNQYYIEPTDDEESAMLGLPESSVIESMLVFCRNYFRHKDFGESEKITLEEYLMAKKDTYTSQMFSKNIQEIREIKSKIQ